MAMIRVWAVLLRELAATYSAAISLCFTKLEEQFRGEAGPQEAPVIVEPTPKLRIGIEAFAHAFFRANSGRLRFCIGAASLNNVWLRINERSLLLHVITGVVALAAATRLFQLLGREAFYAPELQDLFVILPVVVALVLTISRPFLRRAFSFFHAESLSPRLSISALVRS